MRYFLRILPTVRFLWGSCNPSLDSATTMREAIPSKNMIDWPGSGFITTTFIPKNWSKNEPGKNQDHHILLFWRKKNSSLPTEILIDLLQHQIWWVYFRSFSYASILLGFVKLKKVLEKSLLFTVGKNHTNVYLKILLCHPIFCDKNVKCWHILTTCLCPLMQLFINGVNPHMSLPFKSKFLILEKVLLYINQLTWHFRAEVLCWSLL